MANVPSASSYPRWWNAHRTDVMQRLQARGIRDTYDLICAVRHAMQMPVHKQRHVQVSVKDLVTFCKTDLCGMSVCIHMGHREAGTVVCGARPHSIIRHERQRVAREPRCAQGTTEQDAVVSHPYAEWVCDTNLLMELPPECYCPISHEVFDDPVIARDGHTYERAYIEDWFARSTRSPLCNEPLDDALLIPNYAMKTQISRLKD